MRNEENFIESINSMLKDISTYCKGKDTLGEEEGYYTIEYNICTTEAFIEFVIWEGNKEDVQNLVCGNLFKTRAEAERELKNGYVKNIMKGFKVLNNGKEIADTN